MFSREKRVKRRKEIAGWRDVFDSIRYRIEKSEQAQTVRVRTANFLGEMKKVHENGCCHAEQESRWIEEVD
jgi:hypothetical protein